MLSDKTRASASPSLVADYDRLYRRADFLPATHPDIYLPADAAPATPSGFGTAFAVGCAVAVVIGALANLPV